MNAHSFTLNFLYLSNSAIGAIDGGPANLPSGGIGIIDKITFCTACIGGAGCFTT